MSDGEIRQIFHNRATHQVGTVEVVPSGAGCSSGFASHNPTEGGATCAGFTFQCLFENDSYHITSSSFNDLVVRDPGYDLCRER